MASGRADDVVNGQVTITRTTSTHADDYITVSLRHDDEETRAVMSLRDFAMALTGMGRVPAQIEKRDRRGN